MYSRIIKRKEMPDTEGIEWVNAYREKNAVFYPEDPFAAVFKLSDNLFALLTEPYAGALEAWSYIINGPERALLIDTGYGLGNYRALAEKLCGGRPYDVVVTHHHVDHVGGNVLFDKVHCHKYLVPYLEKAMKPLDRDKLMDENGRGIWLDFTENDIPLFKKYEIAPCEDGHIFDLGEGYKVKLLFTPGHAAGGCSLLDIPGRRLFCGDIITAGRIHCPGNHDGSEYEEYGLLRGFKLGLENIVKHIDEFDTIFSGHNKLFIDSSCAKTLLQICAEAVENPEIYDDTGLNPPKTETVYLKNVPGLGQLEYKPTGI